MFRPLALLSVFLWGAFMGGTAQAETLNYEDYPIVKLRTLDKITARTMTFEAKVGTTMKFGEIYIKVQTCRKPPPVEKTEAAAFLQIWQTDALKNSSNWVFSGWMFASSPVISGMDHPVYDVWVIDCLGKDPEEMPAAEATPEGDGILKPGEQPAQPSADELGQDAIGPGEQATDTPEPAETTEGEEAEPVPASNLPADAVADPVDEMETPQGDPADEEQPAQAPPTEAAPEAPAQSQDFQGIY